MDARLCPTPAHLGSSDPVYSHLSFSLSTGLSWQEYPGNENGAVSSWKILYTQWSNPNLQLLQWQVDSFYHSNHLGSPIYILWIYKYTHKLGFFHQRSSFLTTISEVGLTVFMLRGDNLRLREVKWSKITESQQRWESNFQLSVFFSFFTVSCSFY